MKASKLRIIGLGLIVAAASGCDWLYRDPYSHISYTPMPSSSPLPSASPSSSDFSPQAARTQIVSAVSGSPFGALFSSRLINDGIGILSLGMSDAAPTGARNWGRLLTDDHLDFSAASDVYITQTVSRRARLVFTAWQSGQWIGDYPGHKHLVAKPIADSVWREARLEEQGLDQWQVSGLSVRVQHPDHVWASINSVSLGTAEGSVDYATSSLPIAQLLAALPGETVNIVVHASTSAAMAFAYGGGGRRYSLKYDATDAQGARFVGAVAFPSGPAGPTQLGIDLISASTIESPEASYDATIWGVPVMRKGDLK